MLNYAITDPRYYGDLHSTFSEFTRLKSADFILFRDKSSVNYVNSVKIFTEFKSEFRAKFIIQNDIDLALNSGVDGIHFSSANLQKLKNTPKNLIKFASTHDDNEINLACEFGADFITFSPIFATPDKGKPKGLDALRHAVCISKVPVFALGGIIDDEQISQISSTGVIGFASIRYFAN